MCQETCKNVKTEEVKKELAEKFRGVLSELYRNSGTPEKIGCPSIADTPSRVAKLYVDEIFKGLFTPPPVLTTFPNKGNYTNILIEKDIEFTSCCEHHFLPIIGKATIAYIPEEKILGLSKFHRVVDWFASRPQVQENLTTDIFDFLCKSLATENVYVLIKADHYCCKIRGVKDQSSSTITTSIGGKFWQPEVRQELLTLISL